MWSKCFDMAHYFRTLHFDPNTQLLISISDEWWNGLAGWMDGCMTDWYCLRWAIMRAKMKIMNIKLYSSVFVIMSLEWILLQNDPTTHEIVCNITTHVSICLCIEFHSNVICERSDERVKSICVNLSLWCMFFLFNLNFLIKFKYFKYSS